GGVEHVDATDDRRRADVVGIVEVLVCGASRAQLVLVEERDGLHALEQVLAELFDGACAGETTDHANDCDRLSRSPSEPGRTRGCLRNHVGHAGTAPWRPTRSGAVPGDNSPAHFLNRSQRLHPARMVAELWQPIAPTPVSELLVTHRGAQHRVLLKL